MPHFDVQRREAPEVPLLTHIPHSAIFVPPRWRRQIILDDEALAAELLAMTDRHTEELFAPPSLSLGGAAFVNRVSRLVCDPERFPDDAQEPMCKKGMGAVYTHTANGGLLRAPDFSALEREEVLSEIFRPYANAIEAEVEQMLERFGRCLIIDGHSFPSMPLPYEDPTLERPDICLGSDPYHSDPVLVEALSRTAQAHGWSVGHNTPFSGSYVPFRHFERDERVTSVMIEVNRGRYMDEVTGERRDAFEEVAALVGELVETAIRFEAFRHTHFKAQLSTGPLCLHVGRGSPQLDALLARQNQTGWAYITAYNPGGREASPDDNERAQGRLSAELVDRGFTVYAGAGEADVGDWPPEPSLLVLGVAEEEALLLCERYGQAAVVVGQLGGEARLVTPAAQPLHNGSSL